VIVKRSGIHRFVILNPYAKTFFSDHGLAEPTGRRANKLNKRTRLATTGR